MSDRNCITTQEAAVSQAAHKQRIHYPKCQNGPALATSTNFLTPGKSSRRASQHVSGNSRNTRTVSADFNAADETIDLYNSICSKSYRQATRAQIRLLVMPSQWQQQQSSTSTRGLHSYTLQ